MNKPSPWKRLEALKFEVQFLSSHAILVIFMDRQNPVDLSAQVRFVKLAAVISSDDSSDL